MGYFDFPADPEAWAAATTDQYMVGDRLLAAPVLEYEARSRPVYLPALAAGAAWTDHWTNATLVGGQTVTAKAPLGQMPMYWRA